MENTSATWRPIAGLLALAAVVALSGLLVTQATAQGVTREQLEAHGWTCVEFLPANRWSCFDPGVGRPFPGNPDPAPSYNFLGFDRATGDFLYTGHLIRGDLYAGQPCGPGSEPYVFRALIGYYECVRG